MGLFSLLPKCAFTEKKKKKKDLLDIQYRKEKLQLFDGFLKYFHYNPTLSACEKCVNFSHGQHL